MSIYVLVFESSLNFWYGLSTELLNYWCIGLHDFKHQERLPKSSPPFCLYRLIPIPEPFLCLPSQTPIGSRNRPRAKLIPLNEKTRSKICPWHERSSLLLSWPSGGYRSEKWTRVRSDGSRKPRIIEWKLCVTYRVKWSQKACNLAWQLSHRVMPVNRQYPIVELMRSRMQ